MIVYWMSSLLSYSKKEVTSASATPPKQHLFIVAQPILNWFVSALESTRQLGSYLSDTSPVVTFDYVITGRRQTNNQRDLALQRPTLSVRNGQSTELNQFKGCLWVLFGIRMVVPSLSSTNKLVSLYETRPTVHGH